MGPVLLIQFVTITQHIKTVRCSYMTYRATYLVLNGIRTVACTDVMYEAFVIKYNSNMATPTCESHF